MKEIDFSKAPKDYPLWIEPTDPSSTCEARWHKERDNGYLDEDGFHWGKEGEGKLYVVYRPPVAWDGEGLPPVGAVCEVNYRESWQRCEIIAHFHQRGGMVAAFTVSRLQGFKSLDAFTVGNFRPLLTAEQIAAEAREVSVKQMMKDVSCASARDIFEDLYDAGYRKVEKENE